MIIAGITLWLLFGLLAMLLAKRHDGTIPLLAAIFFVLAGPIGLLVILGDYLMDIEI